MNFKTTIVLLVVLAGIGVYLFVSRTTLETPATKTEEARKLIAFKPEDVQKVSIAPASGKPLIFERSGNDWKMVEPTQGPAESFEVDDLVRDITALQSRGTLDADKKASLGLDHPAYKVQVTTKDNKTATLDVGDKPPMGDTLAVVLDGHDKPEIVNASFYTKLEKKPDSYRRTRLVTVSTDQVRQLSITRKGQTLRLEKQGNDWQVVEPEKMPADSAEVSNLLFGISGLTARKFPSGYTSEEAGLVKPRAVIRYSTEAPTTAPATSATTRSAGTEIKLGGYEDVTRDNLFAQVEDGPIATVAASTFDTFNKTPLDLRDRKVVDIDPDRVESFSIHVDRASTTQPTTRPAEQRTFTIARRSEKNAATEPAGATTQPATGPTTALAQTQPTTRAVAASRPSPATQPLSKWVFRGAGEANAEEGQVSTLLSALHPLRADKYLEKAPTTQPSASFTLTVQTGPGPTSGPAEHSLRFVDPGGDAKLIGFYNDLVFEADRALAKDLEGDFKTRKAEPAPAPAPSSPLPFGHP